MNIPAWLISMTGIIFMGVVLERLYIAKVPVKIWGIDLNQPIGDKKFFTLVLTNPVGCHNSCNKDLGNINNRFCFLTRVQGAFNGAAESVAVRPDGSSWRLVTASGGSPTWAEARCIKY